ncbi:MAG: VanZ family protein [Planctomycetes bacterium]|nr:VanZ family protein [Planctomycetota bacterium]
MGTSFREALAKPIVRTLICVSIFITAFVVTHLPPPDQPIKPLEHDKLLHTIGFVGLGTVLAWRLSATHRPFPLVTAMAWYSVLITYGAFDELTQPITGRSCELLDFLADGLGGIIGMGLIIVAQTMRTRSARHQQGMTS